MCGVAFLIAFVVVQSMAGVVLNAVDTLFVLYAAGKDECALFAVLGPGGVTVCNSIALIRPARVVSGPSAPPASPRTS